MAHKYVYWSLDQLELSKLELPEVIHRFEVVVIVYVRIFLVIANIEVVGLLNSRDGCNADSLITFAYIYDPTCS